MTEIYFSQFWRLKVGAERLVSAEGLSSRQLSSLWQNTCSQYKERKKGSFLAHGLRVQAINMEKAQPRREAADHRASAVRRQRQMNIDRWYSAYLVCEPRSWNDVAHHKSRSFLLCRTFLKTLLQIPRMCFCGASKSHQVDSKVQPSQALCLPMRSFYAHKLITSQIPRLLILSEFRLQIND